MKMIWNIMANTRAKLALSLITDFTVTVREFELATGAGFVIPVLGDLMRMPGLPTTPAAEHIDIDDEGKIVGLS